MDKQNKEREGQVTLQMENLKGRLSELEKGVAEIKIRLSSVIRGDTLDNDEKAAHDEQESLVPLRELEL